MTLSLQEPAHVDEPREIQEFADVLTRVATDRQTVVIRREGVDVAAIVPLEYLELLQESVARAAAEQFDEDNRLEKLGQYLPAAAELV